MIVDDSVKEIVSLIRSCVMHMYRWTFVIVWNQIWMSDFHLWGPIVKFQLCFYCHMQIFGFYWWESVKTFMCGLGHLDFKHIYALRCFKFWKSVYISSSVVLRTVLSCFANGQDFNQLCYLYGVSVMCMNFSELTCVVYMGARRQVQGSARAPPWILSRKFLAPS